MGSNPTRGTYATLSVVSGRLRDVHPPDAVTAALEAVQAGEAVADAARRLGLPRSTLAGWVRSGPPARRTTRPCPRCTGSSLDEPGYAHLLGLYLGDGCLSEQVRRGVYALRIACADDYPRLVRECEDSIRAVRPGPVARVRKQGCVSVEAYWRHWPCLFPQHGPGRKHERPIVLEPWQREVVEQHPGRFLRGLFHSDGCRVQNWASRTVDGVTTRYEGYPRYFFSNRSPDVIGLCTWALDLLGVRWTRPRPDHVSVARREAEAVLDEHVGPKS